MRSILFRLHTLRKPFRLHTSIRSEAYADSLPAYVSVRQHTSYGSIRLHTSICSEVSACLLASVYVCVSGGCGPSSRGGGPSS